MVFCHKAIVAETCAERIRVRDGGMNGEQSGCVLILILVTEELHTFNEISRPTNVMFDT